jgi:dihydrofolate reductase
VLKEQKMRKIIAGLFMTLDGVVEAPGKGDTTLPDKRGWSEPYVDQEVGMSIFEAMNRGDALLLGRKTYQGFSNFWPSVPDDDPFGKFMNGIPKYVVSTTLDKAQWNNSKLIKGNVTEELSRLKQGPGKDLNISGSGILVQWLLQHDLLDELQLLVCPVVLGTGKHLFSEGMDTKTLKLVNTKPFNSGMVLLTYQPDRK